MGFFFGLKVSQGSFGAEIIWFPTICPICFIPSDTRAQISLPRFVSLFQTSGCSMRLVASVIGFGYDEKTSHVVSVMGNKEGPTKAESWASS
jgi:hypothetical protein